MCKHFVFFNETATTWMYTYCQHLALHDALPTTRLQEETDERVAHIGLDYADHSKRQSRKIKVSVHKGLNAMGAGQSMTSNYGVSGSPGYDLDFTRYNTALEQAFVLPYKFGLKFSAEDRKSTRLNSSH